MVKNGNIDLHCGKNHNNLDYLWIGLSSICLSRINNNLAYIYVHITERVKFHKL